MTISRTFVGGAPTTHLSAPITAAAPAPGATFSVTAGTGANYPTTNFVVAFTAAGVTTEKVFISSRTGDVFTVGGSGRGFDGTTAADHPITEDIDHELDAATMTAILLHINSTAGDDHTQYLNTARHDVTTRHTFGAALGTPATPQSVGAANSAGTGTVPAREDHVHALAAGLMYATNLGAAVSQSFVAEADATGLTAITFTADGTSRYRLHLHCANVVVTSGQVGLFRLREGATLIGIIEQVTAAAASQAGMTDAFWEWVPTAGSHTYKITGACAGAGGFRMDTAQASGLDTYLSVERIG